MNDQFTHIAESLAATVRRSADEQAGEWFAGRLAALAGGYDRNVFLAAYAGAGRRLRAFTASPLAADVAAAVALGVASFPGWPLDRFARCALLCAVLDAAPAGEHSSIVDEVFRTGDNDEREALLAGLLLFPEPVRFLSTAVEACRSNVETVFSAVACENAYASIYFSDESLNQMVMKVAFTGLPLARVVGLADRRNDELARMADNYASERTAAGRSVPADLGFITPRSRSSTGSDAKLR